MSKTIDLQIEKISTLIEGINRNAAELAGKGITRNDVETMQALSVRLTEANKVCEAKRAELSEQVRSMNATLVQVKELFQETKRKIKTNYPQYDWAKYGVMDKR